MTFEFDPWRVCKVCRTRTIRPSDAEKWAALKEHYDDMWYNISDEYKEECLNGFNLPRLGPVRRKRHKKKAPK